MASQSAVQAHVELVKGTTAYHLDNRQPRERMTGINPKFIHSEPDGGSCGGFHRLPREDGGATVHAQQFFCRKQHGIHQMKALNTYITNPTLFKSKSSWIVQIERKHFLPQNFQSS